MLNKYIVFWVFLVLTCETSLSQQYYFDVKGKLNDENAVYHTDKLCPSVCDGMIDLQVIQQYTIDRYKLKLCEYCDGKLKYKDCSKTYLPRYSTSLKEYSYLDQKVDSIYSESQFFSRKIFDDSILISVVQEIPNKDKVNAIASSHVAENLNKTATVVGAAGSVASLANANWMQSMTLSAQSQLSIFRSNYYNGLSRTEESLDILVYFKNLGTQV